MIISHRHRYIFVKTTKTAGTSIEVALAVDAGDDAVVTPVFPAVDGHRPRNYDATLQAFRRLYERTLVRRNDHDDLFGAVFESGINESGLEHLPARVIRDLFPTEWSAYLTFCIERNPFDKLVSGYFDFRARHGTPNLSFGSFLPLGLRLMSNHRHYTDEAGEIMVDRVIRFEDLDQDLGSLLTEFGVPFETADVPREKGGVRPAGDHYRDHYDSARRTLVQEAFAWEIEHFGYVY